MTPFDPTVNHAFQGPLITCAACHKGRSNAIHSAAIEMKPCMNCKEPIPAPAYTDFQGLCPNCTTIVTQVLPPQSIIDKIIADAELLHPEVVPPAFNPTDQPGNYISPEPAQNSEVAQDAAIIHRQMNVDEIVAAQTRVLTPRETIEIMGEHEAIIALAIKNMSWTDAAEYIDKHIRDIRSKIERFRTCEMAARKVRTVKQIEETTKLSPEEREQYKRDAVKQAKKLATAQGPKPVDPKKEAQKWLDQRNKMIDMMVAAGMCTKEAAEKNNPINAEVMAVLFPPPAPPAYVEPAPRMSKRDKIIAQLRKAGLTQAQAEAQLPEGI